MVFCLNGIYPWRRMFDRPISSTHETIKIGSLPNFQATDIMFSLKPAPQKHQTTKKPHCVCGSVCGFLKCWRVLFHLSIFIFVPSSVHPPTIFWLEGWTNHSLKYISEPSGWFRHAWKHWSEYRDSLASGICCFFFMAIQPTPLAYPPLTRPYFWGGTLGGGWLTSHNFWF